MPKPKSVLCIDGCGRPCLSGRARCRECFNKKRQGKTHGAPVVVSPPPASKWPSVERFDAEPHTIAEVTAEAHRRHEGHDEKREALEPGVDSSLSLGDDAATTSDEPTIDVGMFAFGTPIQRATAEAFIRLGGVVEAAEELQLTPAQLRAHLSELQRRAAARGYAPGHSMTATSPEGFSVKGVSTLYDAEGNIRGQWVKTKRDDEVRVASLLDAMSTIAARWEGLADPIAAPAAPLDDDLLAVYGMGDPHIGMFSWALETGNNHDLAIAERDLYGAADQLVGLAPAAKNALVISAGDFFHADNRGNTTTGGTPVDSDGRWPKVLSTGVRLMRRMIDRALEKHEHVTVICEIGNHDWHTSIMLATCLAQFYEREPRVTVDTSPAKYHWYRFGKVLIGTTHADTVKLAALGEVMATDRAQDWGETLYRYWITGHIHHETVKELRGCIVRSLRTLAPADAWHRGQGYRSGQEMICLVMHREWGQINQHTVGIRQVRAALGAES